MRVPRNRGGLLIELFVGLVIALIISAGVFKVFVSSFASRDTVLTVNDSVTEARRPVDTLADHLRNAQRFSDGSVTAAVFPTDGTRYTDGTHIVYGTASGGKVCYYLEAGSLKRADANGTTAVLSGVTGLSFTYYTYGINYYSSSSPATTLDPHAPTQAECSLLCAVQIDATVTVGNQAQAFTAFVRLRNSPSKTHL